VADNKPTTNPPVAPAPKSEAATPSMQGVTKPGQGAVPETPGTGSQVVGPAGAQPLDAGRGQPSVVEAVKAGEIPATLTSKDDTTTKAQGTQSVRTGPAIQTSKTESPYKVRARALEAELKGLSDSQTRAGVERRAIIRSQLDELAAIEGRRYGGANIRTPRGNLLHAGAVQEANPDLHLRYVNESIPGRADMLQSMGYQRLGTPGGDTVLWGIPREQWAKNEIGKRQETERGLRRATTGAREAALEEIQKDFDARGINVNAREVFGNASGRDD
jgi:hypothetical protein